MWERKQPRGTKSPASCWTWTHLKTGGVLNGHLAGPVEWIVTHWHYRSLPCYTDVTDKRLECPHCKAGHRMGELGYVPIYREDGRPCVVGIPSYNAAGLHGVGLGEAVKAFRGKERGDPIVVMRNKGVPNISVGPEGSRPVADIREWLVRLWRDETLKEFFARGPLADADADTAILRRAAETRRAAEEAARDVPGAIARRIRVTPPAVDGDRGPALMGDVIDGIGLPERNGRHKPR